MGCVNRELQNMSACRMRIALMAVIVYYSVSFQRVAATVLYKDELTGELIDTFDGTTGLSPKIDWRFPFIGQIRNSLRISKDGFIVVDSDSADDPAVTVNVLRTTLTAGSGSVRKLLTNDPTTLSQVNRDIQPYFSVVGSYTFNAKWALLVTWYEVTAPSSTNKNTFQLVLATNGVASFAMMNYKTIASSGLGTVQVGFNSPGNGFYKHPLETVTAQPKLTTLSNVGVTGRWLYRVDGRGVLEPDCVGFTISTESGINMNAPFGVENVPSGCVTSGPTSRPAVPSTTFATSSMLVPCNAEVSGSVPRFPGMSCVSIVPVFAPDMLARHAFNNIFICSDNPEDPTFKQDSSFIIRPNSFKTGFFALQSYNNPGAYIKFQPSTVQLDVLPTAPIQADYNNSASFTLGILPSCPYGDKATWCSTIDSSLCSQAPFDVLCRATCDARTTTTATTTTTKTTTKTTEGMGPLELTKCARPAYRIANSKFCKQWFPSNRRHSPARWSNWAGPRADPWARRGAGRRF